MNIKPIKTDTDYRLPIIDYRLPSGTERRRNIGNVQSSGVTP